jgi:predicted MFS family arabinose efflux permease
MNSLGFSGAARRLLAISVVAQLPLGMLGIGLLVHTQRLTDSFAVAGLVTGVYAISVGVGGPPLGQLVDRGSQTAVLLASAGAATVLLGAAAILPAHPPLAALLALATGIGLATPPVGACLRARLPALLPDPASLSGAYAVETSAVELCWVCGPPLVLGLGALWSTGGALAVSGLILLVATVAFAAQPTSRARRPIPSAGARHKGALATPTMRTLTVLLLGVGLLLGADEVAVTATAKAIEGSGSAAAPLLALWGAGSFAGGLVLARIGGARSAAALALLLFALTIGHLALIPAAGAIAAFGAVLFLAGGAIAPTQATVYAMVEDAAPPGTITEAFAWLDGAIAAGGAAGAAVAGVVVDTAGATTAFALAAAAGALATLTAIVRRRTLARGAVGFRLEDDASGGAPCPSVS